MPIPFIVGGVVAGAAAVAGIGAHLSAKETNERAQELVDRAQELYDESKSSLERAQKETETSLLKLGYAKKSVLDGSIQQFLTAYSRIKDVELSESIGLNEIANFAINEQDVLKLQEMSNIYGSAISSGATGAAAGTVIALAASGSLPIVTGMLSGTGAALVAGEIGIGAAASFAGSALSLGAAMTPLAAVAAPVVLFTGISSSIKADENLEKAQKMYAEADAASEKMKVAKTLCMSISQKADMFDGLLHELDEMFSTCTGLLDAVTRKKSGLFKNKTITASMLSKDELKLVAVTRALAGAVKAVIDTPILTEDGALSNESKTVYNQTRQSLPAFTNTVGEVSAQMNDVKAIPIKKTKAQNRSTTVSLLDAARNVLAVTIAVVAAVYCYLYIESSIVFPLAICSLITLLLMNNKSYFRIFKFVKILCCAILAIVFGVVFHQHCNALIHMRYFLLIDIVFGMVTLIAFGALIASGGQRIGSIRKTLIRLSACFLCFAVALILFALLFDWINLSWNVSIIITEILLVLCTFLGTLMGDYEE